MNFTLKELKTKSKSELVEIALNYIKTNSINKADYKISVFKNSKEVIVTFERIVRFITAKNKRANFDVTINVVTKESVPYGTSFLGNLFKPSAYDLKAIAFVKKYLGNFSPNFLYTITETESEYIIESSNEHSLGIYTLIKKTGEIIAPLETSYEPAPEPNFPEKDPLIEVF